VITLYAITDHPTPPVPPLGAMRVIASGDLAAVCGPVQEGEVTADSLWRHERLVEALMNDRDVLPVRYGTCLPDEAAAVRTLHDNHAEYLAALEAVRGAVELAVRVFGAAVGDDAPAPTPPHASMTGTAYLRARSRAAADESGATKIVHEPLAREARAATVAPVNRPGERLRAAYLVDRAATGTFSERVQEIQDEHPQLRITCTGPWPPYSFARR
jgi:Gas vesicle synthesis protein GvpL/GvpF